MDAVAARITAAHAGRESQQNAQIESQLCHAGGRAICVVDPVVATFYVASVLQ